MNQPIKTIDDLYARAGTQERLAYQCNVLRATVSLWQKHGIPQKYWEILAQHYAITPAEIYAINQQIKNKYK